MKHEDDFVGICWQCPAKSSEQDDAPHHFLLGHSAGTGRLDFSKGGVFDCTSQEFRCVGSSIEAECNDGARLGLEKYRSPKKTFPDEVELGKAIIDQIGLHK